MPETPASDRLVALSPARVAALCDGVFAIAMTILVLNITVPTPAKVPAAAAGRVASPHAAGAGVRHQLHQPGRTLGGPAQPYHFITRADRWRLDQTWAICC